jgi:sugar O-acyltransferase (sialic acid O-acetyltransferase NeuD family)
VKPVLLLGGGGHCRASIDVIEAEGHYRVLGVVERVGGPTVDVLGYPVLGDDGQLGSLILDCPRVLVTVGQIATSTTRRDLFARGIALGAAFPVVRSPSAYVSTRAELGAGTLVMHGAVVNTSANVGLNCIVNSLALIEHDAEVGAHCHVSTGARVNGGAVVGEGTFIGSGAVLHEGVTIGAESVIGAGIVVDRDIPPGTWLRRGGQ